MDETIIRQAVLFADISGSTRLYERYGDDIARADVAACLEVLTGVAERCGGRVAKTIGDEVMCVFANPARAATAASEMHEALQEASEAGRFRTGTLRIKIGWHYGAVYTDEGELHGEAPVTAQQVIRMAKAGQVLTSGAALAALPAAFKRGARFVDNVDAEAYSGKLEVWDLPWEEGDDLTKVGSQSPLGGVIVHKRMTLEHGPEKSVLDASRPTVTLGRGDDNDVVVLGRFASRVHARVSWRHGRFHLRDDSTNGIVLITADGTHTRLHREETMLPESGSFCLGATPEEDPGAVVTFTCE